MKIFFVTLLALLGSVAKAQFNIGLKGVFNVSNVSIEGESATAKVGFAGGLYTEVGFAKKIGLIAEVLYNEKGTKDASTGTEIKTNLNYLSIPILFYFEPLQNLKLTLGPELAFLLSAKAKGDLSTMDIKEFYETFDKGIAFGGSYGFGRLGINARYVAGLEGITTLTFTDPDTGLEELKKAGSNKVIQIALSFRLNKLKIKK